MNNETNNEAFNVELSPDNIVGYLVTSEGYQELEEDRRKKPTFYWKAYHLYPFLVADPDYDFDEEDGDDVELAICTEGGDKDTYNFVSMTASELQAFVRAHTQFRMMEAAPMFEELHFV